MKIIVFNNKVVSSASDDQSIIGCHPDCEIYSVPDGTVYMEEDKNGCPIPRNFSDMGITRESSNCYEARRSLRESDGQMARSFEDLVELLEEKGVMTAEELPESVRGHLEKRKSWRALVGG